MKKKSFVALIAMMLCAVMAAAFVGCGAKSYTLTYTDGEEYEEATLPVHSVDSSYAWNMMGITSSVITLTIDGDTYTYLAEDYGNTDKTASMYYYKSWEYTGTCTDNGDGTYKLGQATDVVLVVELGSAFAEYESVWGKSGTFDATSDAGKTALEKFNTQLSSGATAVVSGDTVAFR